MALGEDIRTYLLSKASITAAIGTRLFPDFLPQKNDVFPAIVYLQVSEVGEHMLSGAAGFGGARFQFDVYAKTRAECNAVADKLRRVLQGFPPAGTNPTMGNSTVTSVVHLDQRNGYEAPLNSSDVGLFRSSNDYWFRHDQTAPVFT